MVYEKIIAWTDSGHDPESTLFDEILGNIMVYWLSGTAASSVRLY